MTTERKIIIVLACIIVIAGAVLGRFAWQQHKALHDADTVSAADRATVKALQSGIDMRDQADALQQRVAQQQRSAVKTSSDAIRIIRQYVTVPATGAASVDKPQAVSVQPADVSDAVKQQLPDSPDYVVQTQASAIATAQTLLQCKADQSSLSTCAQDKIDLTAQVAAEHDAAVTWERAAKGGSVAQRFWKVAKCAGMSAGGAAAGQAFGKEARWAAVGAAAGAVGCNFVF